MNKLDEELDKLDFQSKYNKSIKELSNWLLGISIGLFTITVLKLKNENIESTCWFSFHNIVVVTTMLNLIFSGFIKHSIYIRELNLSEIYMETKRLVYFEEKLISKEEYTKRMNQTSSHSVSEYNKGIRLGKLLNINTSTNLIALILFGILILIQ